MEILQTISDFQNIRKGCVLTIGNFDGVHLGHQQILAAAKQAAQQRSADFIVMTFEPHPLAVLYMERKAPGVLTPMALKKHLLAESGADYLFVAKSSPQLLNLSPEDFVVRFVVKNIHPQIVVEGESFNFGCGRNGNVHILKALGDAEGFEVIIVEEKMINLINGQMVAVSSTLIRDLLTSGKVDDVAIALGRPYRLIGQIVPGRGKGRKLGFPTANLDCRQTNMQPSGQLIPQIGVYAGFVGIADSEEKVCAAGEKIPAAFSIGRQDSLGTEPSLLIEAHLLKENIGQLYGKWLAMNFIKRIRDQQKFDTEADLSAQIAKDCIVAGEILY